MIKLFTHNDLDGVGCAIIGIIEFGNDGVDIEYCSYNDINDRVKLFLTNDSYDKYENVFITDMSINEENAEIINSISKSNENLYKFNLIDHHDTALWLNKYEWAWVASKIESDFYKTQHNIGVKSSGTMMFYQWLFESNNGYGALHYTRSYQFVELVRQYDTWEWNELYAYDTAKKLNNLLYIYGGDKFIAKMINAILNYNMLFDETDILVLELEQRKIDTYINSKQEQLMVKDILGYKAGIVFAEQYHSEVGNALSVNNNDLDFIVLINPSYSISYRSTKDSINLGADIAKIFGGGGHAKSAGSPISVCMRNEIFNILFNK